MSTDVTLRGRLARDPELRFSVNGKPVTKFAVVTSRRFKNQQTNEWEDRDTTFWDCVAFNELAQNVADSLEKGTAVVVTGHASQEEWEAKDGTKRKSMKVTAEDVAPSLRFATVKIARATRSGPAASNATAAEADPWATEDKPPF